LAFGQQGGEISPPSARRGWGWLVGFTHGFSTIISRVTHHA